MVLYISLVGVHVASLAIESLLYGFFVILSLTSFYLQFAKEKHSDRPKNSRLAALATPLILANVFLTTAVTAHWVLSIVRALQAFLFSESAPRQYYENLAHPLFVTITAVVIVTLIVGDAVMIYRLRTVFKYNRSTAVFPICCLFGFIACGIGAVFQFSNLSTNRNVFLLSIGTIFTFITNVFCSAFIAWKIYRVNSATTNYSGQNLGSITGIIIESATLYTSWTVMFMAAFLASSNLVYLFADTISVITGISFMLINVRIGLGWAIELAKSTERSTAHSISLRPSAAARSMDDRQTRGTGTYQMRSLAVHIERTVVKDEEDAMTIDNSLPRKETESFSDHSSKPTSHM